MRNFIIAIDGPVGSGKSSVARRVADLLGYVYLDSGAMYRALAWKALERGVPHESEGALMELARETRVDLEATNAAPGQSGSRGILVRVDGHDVTQLIRSAAVSQAASKLAVVAGVRQVLVAEQQRAGRNGGVVMEGRDIGTVVFPHAELKIFLDASPDVRAERRWRQHQEKEDGLTLEDVQRELRERDKRDREREVSPLVRAADAVVVDNTSMDIEETARLIVLLFREHEKESSRKTSSASGPKS
ncbi:MAG TPA: (d)CMP kinase [Candidatus Dormibacteraeota bacterium]|nr:(d)CMP kinase [Candidatus Dormibacteraeota bacterium]